MLPSPLEIVIDDQWTNSSAEEQMVQQQRSEERRYTVQRPVAVSRIYERSGIVGVSRGTGAKLNFKQRSDFKVQRAHGSDKIRCFMECKMGTGHCVIGRGAVAFVQCQRVVRCGRGAGSGEHLPPARKPHKISLLREQHTPAVAPAPDPCSPWSARAGWPGLAGSESWDFVL